MTNDNTWTIIGVVICTSIIGAGEDSDFSLAILGAIGVVYGLITLYRACK